MIRTGPGSGTARGQAGRDCEHEAKLQSDSTVASLAQQARAAPSVHRQAPMLCSAAACIGVAAMTRVEAAIPDALAVLVHIYRRRHPGQPLPSWLQRMIGQAWSEQR